MTLNNCIITNQNTVALAGKVNFESVSDNNQAIINGKTLSDEQLLVYDHDAYQLTLIKPPIILKIPIKSK